MSISRENLQLSRICKDFYTEFSRSKPNDIEIINLSREMKMLANLEKSSFTRNEKQLLYTIGNMIEGDYLCAVPEYQDIDYGAMNVHIELVERAFRDGIEDKNISMITVNVLFNDVLESYCIEYNDLEWKADPAGIPIWWESRSKLYNFYSIYKSKYKGFEEHSISILASAAEEYIKYQSRTEQEKMIITTNGIVANFAAVIEYEFKKIVTLLTGNNDYTFYQAIKAFKEIDSFNSPWLEELSDSNRINNLHFIRKMHNDVDHGNRLTSAHELKKIYNIVIHGDLCQLLSNAYIDLSLE